MREADEAHQDASASDNSDRSDEAHDFVDDRHGIDLLHLMILLYQISGCLSIGRLHKFARDFLWSLHLLRMRAATPIRGPAS